MLVTPMGFQSLVLLQSGENPRNWHLTDFFNLNCHDSNSTGLSKMIPSFF